MAVDVCENCDRLSRRLAETTLSLDAHVDALAAYVRAHEQQYRAVPEDIQILALNEARRLCLAAWGIPATLLDGPSFEGLVDDE